MKNFKYLIIVAIGLLFATSSCSDSEERDRTLTLEQASLTLNKDAQTKTVEITVDQGALFTAEWDGESWGTVIADNTEGVVKITVAENSAKNLRKASIIVTLEGGFRNRVISLTQNGGDPLLSVVPDEISFDFVASEFIVNVESNLEWGTSSNVKWLDVEAFLQTGIIIFKATRNEDYNARSTTITVTAGSSSKEVVVRQSPSPLFLLPYLDTQTASFDDLVAFEEARHAVVMKNTSRFPVHTVITNSLLMPVISSEIIGTAMTFSSMEGINDKYMPGFFRVGTKFGKAHDFMLENDFEFLFSGGDIDYYWAKQPDGATRHYQIAINNALDMKYISYTAKENLPENPNLPTFDAFPYMTLAWGSDKDVARTWEAANGGELDSETISGLEYNVPGDPLYDMRIYAYTEAEEKLWRADFVFKPSERTRIYLLYPNGYGLNPKFAAMITEEGFEYMRDDVDGYPLYKHTAKNTELKVYMTSRDDDPSVYYGTIAYIQSADTPPPAPALPSPYKVVKGIKIIRE